MPFAAVFRLPVRVRPFEALTFSQSPGRERPCRFADAFALRFWAGVIRRFGFLRVVAMRPPYPGRAGRHGRGTPAGAPLPSYLSEGSS